MKDHNLRASQQDELLGKLKMRFEENSVKFPRLGWDKVEQKLKANPENLWSLQQMEETGGEPALVAVESDTFVFMDASPETPAGRRNVCYDRQALDSRKANKPETSALDMCADMGIELLTEVEYKQLQEYREVDLKTSSWIKTPDKIRRLGGALFCDRRYDTVFVYHNGAESYYSSRGFRGVLKV